MDAVNSITSLIPPSTNESIKNVTVKEENLMFSNDSNLENIEKVNEKFKNLDEDACNSKIKEELKGAIVNIDKENDIKSSSKEVVEQKNSNEVKLL